MEHFKLLYIWKLDFGPKYYLVMFLGRRIKYTMYFDLAVKFFAVFVLICLRVWNSTV